MEEDTNGRHSHRSRSRDRRDDRERRRDHKDTDDRRSSRDHSYREKDRRSKSRDRAHRDSRRRESSRDRHRPKDSDRDRRRKREDEMEETHDTNERVKRRKEDSVNGHADDDDAASMTKPMSDRSRDSDRRTVDRRDRDERDRDRERERDKDRDRDRDHRRGYDRRPSHQERPSFDRRSPRPRRVSPGPKRPSPSYEPKQLDPDDPPPDDDSEARSVFVSQLAARLTARDLGYFFEDKLGEGAVRDSRIVTDRLSRRSKGIGYVELRSIEMVDKALALSGTIVMGLPINVQLTESERNRTHSGDGSLNLPPGVHAPLGGGAMQLYVGSLHFNLTESDIKQVFEPFGELEFVDLHKDPLTGRSKGYAFVQYKRPEDAKMALDQMEGFELAGRTLRVNTVHEKGTAIRVGGPQESLDDSGGGNLNAASRQALMQKLARTETTVKAPTVTKPNIPQVLRSECVLLRNMFNPADETEKDWDKDLAEDVKVECQTKYGRVESIKVDKDSQGDIYVRFDSIESAQKSIEGLNGRWFGGNQVSASFISLAMLQAHQ